MRLQLLLGFLLTLAAVVKPSGAIGQSPASESTAGNPSSTEIAELQKKADAGDASAEFTLGHAYETGSGLPKNFEQAVFWYRKSAEQGNPKAQNSLGVLYWLGEGVERDRKQAVEWYRKSARQRDARAMFNLGAAYYNGEGANFDDTLAFAWFLLADEAGDPAGRDAASRSRTEHGDNGFHDACLAIGEMYEKGVDLAPDTQQAITWYKKAAEGPGPGVAETRLAGIYLNTGNYGEARPWCEAAAKNKVPGGAYCLGYLYQRGLSVTQSPKTAFGWYLQAAHGGNLAATKALIAMYQNGEGTRVDTTEAMFWLLRLANRGDTDADADARKLRSSINEKQWKDIQNNLRKRGFDLKKVDAFFRGDSPLRGDSSPAEDKKN